MKKIALVIAMAIINVMVLKAQEAYDKFEIQVDGLGCPFCAYGLEKKFKEFKGIQQVKIDIETGNFTFNYPAEKQLTLEAVEQQVKKAGYTPIAGGVTRSDGTMEAMHKSHSAEAAGVANAQGKTKVAGNCEMCKARIEKAALEHKGVVTANWDKNTKILALGYDKDVTSVEAVEKSVALAGHDTQHHSAHEEDYKNLPACCHYERITPEKSRK